MAKVAFSYTRDIGVIGQLTGDEPAILIKPVHGVSVESLALVPRQGFHSLSDLGPHHALVGMLIFREGLVGRLIAFQPVSLTNGDGEIPRTTVERSGKRQNMFDFRFAVKQHGR